MSKFLITMCLVSLFLILPSTISAANLELIETKVVETAAQKRRTPSAQNIKLEETTQEKSNNIQDSKTQSEAEEEIIWSLFNGTIVLRKINGQVYLSLFS